MPFATRTTLAGKRRRLRGSTRRLAARMALAICAGLLGLVIAEIAYRFAVAISSTEPRVERFNASSDFIYTFDREFGYSYIPDANVKTVRVENGRVWESWQSTVNSQGNIGNPSNVGEWEAAKNRILVAGDSFTANPNFGGVAWPDSLFTPRNSEMNVAVLNFARDGYGILQMVHMARAKAASLDATMIIIAFITDDLTRARFWRTQNQDAKYPRVFTTTLPDETPDAGFRADTTLVNREVERLEIGDNAETLVRQFDAMGAKVKQLRQGLWKSPTYCFVFNRVVRGAPFAGFRTPAQNPRHFMSDFRDDEGFRADTAALNAMNAKILIVHLPTYFEIVAGRPFFEEKDFLLVESLRDSLPQAAYVELLSAIVPPQDGLLSAYHRPLDVHPSRQGARMYGNAVGRIIMDRRLLVTEKKDDSPVETSLKRPAILE